MAPQSKPEDSKYTVFIRLPFPRNEFVDPPPPNWNIEKDRVLWEVLLQPSNAIDWTALASRLDATLPFILQQAAWLYSHRLAQIRADMLKAGDPPPDLPFTDSFSGGRALIREHSDLETLGFPIDQEGVSPSQLDASDLALPRHQEDPSNLRADSPTLPTSEATTIRGMSGQTNIFPRKESSDQPQATTLYGLQTLDSPIESSPEDDSSEPLDMSSSESGSDNFDRQNLLRRFGKFSLHRMRNMENDEDEDVEDPPAFLPLETMNRSPMKNRSSGATLRQQARKTQATTGSTSTTSSGLGSSAPGPSSDHRRLRSQPRPSGATEPAHAGQSGSPGMGSSFSDLDAASVTQSALEEALLDNIQDDAASSRMSILSQSLQNKYL